MTSKLRIDEIVDSTDTGSPAFPLGVTTTALSYTGTLTGGTGVINIGSGQIYKGADGNVGIGTSSPSAPLDVFGPNNSLQAEFNGGIDGRGLAISTALINGVNDGLVDFNARGAGADGTLTFSIDGAEAARIDSSGNLLVGTTSPISGSRIRVVTGGTTNSTYGVFIANPSAERLFYLEDGGTFSTGNAPSSPYNRTTGSAANVFVDSGGILFRSTSSLKYKTDIQDASFGLPDVLKLRPVTYKGINDGDKVFGGLIAEDVHEAGLTEFVQYADDGTPDALFYGNMVSLAFKAIQELKAELDTVKAELNTLKGT